MCEILQQVSKLECKMSAKFEVVNYGLYSARHCNICLLAGPHENEETTAECTVGVDSEIWPVSAKKLRKCTGCLLVVYCSAKHQRLDWPMHQDFCRTTQRIMSSYRVQNLFWINNKPSNKQEMSNAIFLAKYVLREVLNRPLKFHENELTSYPACCNVCYKFGKLQNCKRCGAVSYCSDEHEVADAALHKLTCNKLRLYYCPFKIQGVDDGWITKWQHQKCDMQNRDLISVFHLTTGLLLPYNPTSSKEAYKKFALASDFTGIASLCYVLSHADTRFMKDDDFVILVVGATNERDLWFRQVHTKFFFVQYPQFTNLKLYFIGPETADQSTQAMVDQYLFMNEVRVVEYFTFIMTFETFLSRNKVHPSIIMAYNCGFSEFGGPDQKNPWGPAIVEILQFYNVPFGFTSYTDDEADQDFAEVMRYIEKEKEVNIGYRRMFKNKINPHRDLRPMRNWSFHKTEEFFYRNGYAQAIVVFPSTKC